MIPPGVCTLPEKVWLHLLLRIRAMCGNALAAELVLDTGGNGNPDQRDRLIYSHPQHCLITHTVLPLICANIVYIEKGAFVQMQYEPLLKKQIFTSRHACGSIWAFKFLQAHLSIAGNAPRAQACPSSGAARGKTASGGTPAPLLLRVSNAPPRLVQRPGPFRYVTQPRDFLLSICHHTIT
jgi:hypothetical protein